MRIKNIIKEIKDIQTDDLRKVRIKAKNSCGGLIYPVIAIKTESTPSSLKVILYGDFKYKTESLNADFVLKSLEDIYDSNDSRDVQVYLELKTKYALPAKRMHINGYNGIHRYYNEIIIRGGPKVKD